jgi:hypothetical protein
VLLDTDEFDIRWRSDRYVSSRVWFFRLETIR